MTLSVEQVAAILGEKYSPTRHPFSRRSIERWRRNYGMPYIKCGPRVGFREADVIEWAEKTFVRTNH